MISPDSAIYHLAETSLRVSVVIVALLLLRPWLRRLIGSQWLCVLWLLVLGRLLVPCAIESAWSVGHPSWEVSRVSAPVAGQTGGRAPGMDSAAWQMRVTETAGAVVEVPVNPADNRPNSIAKMLCILWGVGVGIALSGFVLRILQTNRLAAQTCPVTDLRLIAVFEALDPALRRNVELRMTDAVSVPTLAGVRRPQIWIPQAWLEQLSPEEMRHVLFHELGHARRHDMLVQRLFLVAQCLHWFNPVIWIAARMAKADREMACDAWVLARVGAENSSDYGDTLLRIVNLLRPAARVSPVLIEMATSKRELTTRVGAIGSFRNVAAWQGLLASFAAMAGMVLVTTTADSAANNSSGTVASGTSNQQTLQTLSPTGVQLPSSPLMVDGMTQAQIDAKLFGDQTQQPSPVVEGESRIEITISRLEAPLAAWQQLKEDPIGREVLKMDEAITKLGTPPSGVGLTVPMVLSEDMRGISGEALARVHGLVGTKAKKVTVVPGKVSVFTFPPRNGQARALSVKSSLGADATVIDLEITPEGVDGPRSINAEGVVRRYANTVSIASGHTVLLRSYDYDEPANGVGQEVEAIGQLLFVKARIVGKQPVQRPQKPQVEVTAKFFELPNDAAEDEELKALFDAVTRDNKEVEPTLLTKAQIEDLLRTFKQRKDVEMLSAPRVTTKSGQRVVIEIIREVRDPATWEADPENPGAWKVASFETTNAGVTYEVEPEVNPDGTLTMSFKPYVVEALGFVDIETGQPVPGHRRPAKTAFADRSSAWKGFPNYQFVPGHRTNMIFSKRSAERKVTLKSEQSFVLALKETADTKPFEAEAPKGRLLVVVTAEVINPRVE